jgi:hypothetical protein
MILSQTYVAWKWTSAIIIRCKTYIRHVVYRESGHTTSLPIRKQTSAIVDAWKVEIDLH